MNIKIGICQFDIIWENKQKNKNKILSFLKSFKNNDKPQWIIFPEFTLTGFSLNTKITNFTIEDIDFFKNLAKHQKIYLSVGMVLKNYNKLVTINSSGKIISEYSKTHLFSFGNETSIYKPGNKYTNFKIKNFTIVPIICYELRFPYLFWNCALNTDVYVVIANFPATRNEHWITLLKARAIENQAFVIGVNRTGKDPNIEYTGNSLVISPSGEELLNCKNKEGIWTVNLDKKILLETRKKFPFLKDRKICFAK